MDVVLLVRGRLGEGNVLLGYEIMYVSGKIYVLNLSWAIGPQPPKDAHAEVRGSRTKLFG